MWQLLAARSASCTLTSIALVLDGTYQHEPIQHPYDCGSCVKFREVYRMLDNSAEVITVVLGNVQETCCTAAVFVCW